VVEKMVVRMILDHALFEGVERNLAAASWSVSVYPVHRTGKV